ncbi:hypothetical protein C8Q78DRAFT_400805 [Trametes maxima]|nr:hypothetical protein C8Q78DRAFT_400805 [Trametes maxima]
MSPVASLAPSLPPITSFYLLGSTSVPPAYHPVRTGRILAAQPHSPFNSTAEAALLFVVVAVVSILGVWLLIFCQFRRAHRAVLEAADTEPSANADILEGNPGRVHVFGREPIAVPRLFEVRLSPDPAPDHDLDREPDVPGQGVGWEHIVVCTLHATRLKHALSRHVHNRPGALQSQPRIHSSTHTQPLSAQFCSPPSPLSHDAVATRSASPATLRHRSYLSTASSATLGPTHTLIEVPFWRVAVLLAMPRRSRDRAGQSGGDRGRGVPDCCVGTTAVASYVDPVEPP